MDYFDLAIQAKREKKFDLALEYYGKIGDEQGLSPNLLTSIAKVFYLKGFNSHAIAFNLASIHLGLHTDLVHYKRGDQAIAQALQQVPEKLANLFPHPIGALIAYDRNALRHLSHALVDHEGTFGQTPEFRPYADMYYALILGDGSHGQVFEHYQLSNDDLMQFEEQHYFRYAYQTLIDNIKWTEIENPNVWELYLNVTE